MQAMKVIKPLPARLTVAVLLAQLLQRLDGSVVAMGAEQYRSVARHLVEEFDELQGDAALSDVLAAYPAAAELYENLNYRHAGLCRSPLDLSLDAEAQARKAIARAMRRPGSEPG
jgi:hypothetical protein